MIWGEALAGEPEPKGGGRLMKTRAILGRTHEVAAVDDRASWMVTTSTTSSSSS